MEKMSPDAAGIVATLYALNVFAEQAGPYFSDKYIQLYEFMRLHPEVEVIVRPLIKTSVPCRNRSGRGPNPHPAI